MHNKSQEESSPVFDFGITLQCSFVFQISGPDVHPGAIYVENESGYRTLINPKDKTQREGLAKTLLTAGTGDGLDAGIKFVHR